MQRPRGKALFCGVVLLAMAMTLLWLDRGFAVYTATGLFWDEAPGIVTDAAIRSVPTIAFSTPDGAEHRFKEDYDKLCRGSRKFCYVRSFQLGEQVPVVYYSKQPERAYVHDWALYGSILGFLMDLMLTVLLVLMLAAALLWRKPMRASVKLGPADLES